MNARPRAAKPTPTTTYGQREWWMLRRWARSGASLPAARLAASAVSPLRDHARNVRSAARRVRRVASTSSGESTTGGSATGHILAPRPDDGPGLGQEARQRPVAGDRDRLVEGEPGGVLGLCGGVPQLALGGDQQE